MTTMARRLENEMKETNTSSGGVGFCGLLTVAFIVLRLTGYIDWDWWWVLAPLWVPLLILFVVFVVREAWERF